MKKISTLPVLLIFLCISNQVAAQMPPPAPRSEMQNWNDVQLTVPINKKVDVVINGALRIGRGMSRPVNGRGGVGIAFKLHPRFTFTPGYLYVAHHPSRGRNNDDHRLLLNGTIRFPVGRFTISDRNLYEYLFRHSLPNSSRYRNRLQVERAVSIGDDLSFNVFVANEVWYDIGQKGWTRNRFSTGVSRRLNRHLVGEVYYLRQSDGRARPGSLNVIGTAMRFNL